jgi:hypothetical protein
MQRESFAQRVKTSDDSHDVQPPLEMCTLVEAALFGSDASKILTARKQMHVEPCSGMFPPVSSLYIYQTKC